MKKNLHVLIIDDSEPDFLLLRRALQKWSSGVECRRVESEPEMVAALVEESWDLFLSDCSMPNFTPEAALKVW